MDYDNIEDAYSACERDSSYADTPEECKEAMMEFSHVAGEDMLWRIVRVNGDGTIRLIADGAVGDSKFNEDYDDEKYVGYTYDNSAPNVQDGTNSTIKTYLENWYTTNMSEYDNLIASTRYCNDTSVSSTSGSDIDYGAYGRLVYNKTPQFTCPNTTKTYGGKYDLKIGLLTADEAAFAGNSNFNRDYYLHNMSDYWLGAPGYYSPLIDGATEFINIGYGSYTRFNVSGEYGINPVINLRADILYTSGNGTKSSPYVINLNSI